MIKKRVILFFVQMVLCIFLSIIMTGCGVKDAALVLPLEEGTGLDAVDIVPDETFDLSEGTQGEDKVYIYVYVCGAVVNPGVVKLPEGSRVEAALESVGGFAEDADREYVNLAAKLEDGEKIYFPTTEEAAVLEAERVSAQFGLVNINTADKALLMTLPGIGEARAGDIISYREVNGPFLKKEELKKISGIKENMYRRLEDKIIVQ